MKYTFYLLLTLITISCQRNINLRITETTETATVVKGNRFEGVIFSETMELDTIYEKRFTPTVSEIELAETVLREQLKSLNMQDRKNSIRSCPIIDKHLNKYTRQYGGFIDENRKRIILLNGVLTQSSFLATSNKHINIGIQKVPMDETILAEKWTNTYCSEFLLNFTCGYCSKFWNVKFDLEQKNLYDFDYNNFLMTGRLF